YYGIGAVLQSRDGQVVISELVVGGPAWRSQQVEKGDVIVKVGQDDGELVNVEGMPMEDLIKLTRGAKGSSVTIAFRKADGSIQNVRMVRTALQLDDTFVKSAIIEDDGKKFGFIHLPKFYTNFGDENGRSCADDIEKELKKLMREKVDGIILDIRSNGGGSLGEVINMVGLFVDRGPVVQVKGRGNDKQVGQVTKRKVYDGPLAILVNELSASASEIFAGAMQDYKRGIIIGSPSTYGKGTVQRTFPMPGRNWAEQESDLGTIHITVQKYYRITGNSTQLKGVEPDIKLPGFYEHMEVREKHLETAMPWDEISSAGFSVSKVNAERIKLAVQKSLERQEKDTILQRLKYHLNWISGRNNLYSLDRNKFRDERNLLKEHTQKSREYSVLNYKLNIRNTQEDEIRISAAEEFRQENNKSWLRNLEKDRYLGEALHVVKDMAELREIEIPESRPFQPAGRQGEKKVVMKQREAA
ncbi:MAG TPA: carboxy terminal-processing peptidase, partial [Parasegetibacter sp.]